MEHLLVDLPVETKEPVVVDEQTEMVEISKNVYYAHQCLYFTFILVPLIAGLDKYVHLLTNWDQFVSPLVARLVPVHAHGLMMVAGLIEFLMAILVAVRPRIGAIVLGCWFAVATINLVILGSHLDLALCSLGLIMGCAALALLAEECC